MWHLNLFDQHDEGDPVLHLQFLTNRAAEILWAATKLNKALPFAFAKSLLLLAALVVVSGCETPAGRLEASAVAAIKPGVTTRQEVLRDFGTPRQTTKSDGKTLMQFERDFPAWRGEYGPTQPATIVGLSILCNSEDVVIRKHHSSHHVNVFYGRGVISIGSELTENAVAQIKINETTLKGAIALLGEPARESLTIDGNLILEWLALDANFLGGGNNNVFWVLFDDQGIARGSTGYQHRR